MTHIEEALDELQRVLEPTAGDARAWTAPAGPPEQRMEWTCWETAAHIAHDLAAYAGQLAARPEDCYLPFDLVVRPGTPPREVLRVIRASGGMLTSTLATAGPEVRAYHWGPCDPTGFEAMGVAEAMLHTYDITQGLGVPWTPPARSATYVIERLFPDAPAGDPAEVLLWCTGRGELPGHKRVTAWVWQAVREG
ncbi:hypothetical protein OG897_25405 [Streptomyces sp. NBC_00237]|uniref:hypothetical protein n=1 Tax=Streptomyces sp. NBC_00237 TaxID=2975687 RepID=UPI00225B94DB|nr:hypothetical protein [Streptomyces sp. NBC_00237]MCX5204780.1 hypothetical protein [Streptomyces sp. NBC_00237]